MAADPTISTYSLAISPQQFNDKSVDSSGYPKTFSFAEIYNTPVPALGNQSIQQVFLNPSYHDVKITRYPVNR